MTLKVVGGTETPEKSLKEAALRLAAKGKPVFPCQANKRPYTQNGFKDATSDPTIIEGWWTDWPDALIGLPTGAVSGVVVVDLDNKQGIDGRESFAEIEAKHGRVPETVEVLTPSGGAHLYFRHPGNDTEIKTTAGQIGLGVDIRGDGGYVIVAPSPGYELEGSSPSAPAQMPEWLISLTAKGKPKEKAEKPSESGEKPFTDLSELIDGILSGSPLHDSLRSLAAHFRATGVAEPAAIAYLRGLMTRSKAVKDRPAEWQQRYDDIPRLVRTADQFAPELEWDLIENRVPERQALTIQTGELMSAKLAPRCIVENHTYADVAQLVAPGGTGKTTLILYELIHIILGRPLWGLAVRSPGWCLVVTAEDQRERLIARLREIMDAMGLETSDRAKVMRGLAIWDITGEQLTLTMARDGNLELTGLADSIVERFKDDPPQVALFDPLVSFGVSEERVNTNEQALITAARRIVRGLNCCVRYIHHTGQSNAREKSLDQYSGRGGSALADGSRMTTVLQSWEDGDKRQPPAGFTAKQGISILIMSRAKLSYAPPNQPLIWIKREGYQFEYSTEVAVPPDQKKAAKADQLERFIVHGLAQNRYYTQRDLEELRDDMGMSRAEVRRSLAALRSEGRATEAELPANLKHGARKTYVYCAASETAGGAI